MVEREQPQPLQQIDQLSADFGEDWLWRSDAYHDLKLYLTREKGYRSNDHVIPIPLMKALYEVVGLKNYLHLDPKKRVDSVEARLAALASLQKYLVSHYRKIRHNQTSHSRGTVERRLATNEEVAEMMAYITTYLVKRGFIDEPDKQTPTSSE